MVWAMLMIAFAVFPLIDFNFEQLVVLIDSDFYFHPASLLRELFYDCNDTNDKANRTSKKAVCFFPGNHCALEVLDGLAKLIHAIKPIISRFKSSVDRPIIRVPKRFPPKTLRLAHLVEMISFKMPKRLFMQI